MGEQARQQRNTYGDAVQPRVAGKMSKRSHEEGPRLPPVYRSALSQLTPERYSGLRMRDTMAERWRETRIAPHRTRTAPHGSGTQHRAGAVVPCPMLHGHGPCSKCFGRTALEMAGGGWWWGAGCNLIAHSPLLQPGPDSVVDDPEATQAAGSSIDPWTNEGRCPGTSGQGQGLRSHTKESLAVAVAAVAFCVAARSPV